MADDKMILDHAFLRTATPEQIVNYCDARVAELAKMIKNKPPPPTNEVTAREHLSWTNRFLIHYGRCIESLVAAQAWGHITVEQFKALKTKLEATIQWKLADVMMGGLG
jgi:hypothetical protein